MLKFMKLVPPWVWVSLGAIVVTTGVGVGAWIYQKAVFDTVASVKEQIYAYNVWQQQTNIKFEKEQIKIDGNFKDKIKANDEEWK